MRMRAGVTTPCEAAGLTSRRTDPSAVAARRERSVQRRRWASHSGFQKLRFGSIGSLPRHRSHAMTKVRTLERQPAARLDTPTDLSDAAVREISAALNALLADAFALYLKTKNFHWHISGPHFRDYHLLLDEQAEQIFATTDELAERVRKIGGTTLRSVGDVARHQSI